MLVIVPSLEVSYEVDADEVLRRELDADELFGHELGDDAPTGESLERLNYRLDREFDADRGYYDELQDDAEVISMRRFRARRHPAAAFLGDGGGEAA